MYRVLITPFHPLFREWCCGAPVPSGGSAGAAVGSLPGRRPVRGSCQPAVAAGRHSGRHGRRGGPYQRSQGLTLTTSQQERGQGKHSLVHNYFQLSFRFIVNFLFVRLLFLFSIFDWVVLRKASSPNFDSV